MKVKKIVGIIAVVIFGLVVLISTFNIVVYRNVPIQSGRSSMVYETFDMVMPELGETTFRRSRNDIMAEEERVITRNRVTIETRNIERTLRSIEELIQEYEGRIISKNTDLGDRQWAQISVQIPTETSADFIDKINKNHSVSSFFADVRDVTEQYINTEREIASLRRKIELYEELKGQTPIREIDARIRIVQEVFWLENQIERLERGNEDIDERVQYRDVTITLSAPERLQGERNYWHNTMQMVISILQGTTRVIIAVASILLPFAIVIGIPVLVVQKVRKRKQEKK